MTWRGDDGGVRVCGRLCHRLWTARVFRDGVARGRARPRYKVKFGMLRMRIAQNWNRCTPICTGFHRLQINLTDSRKCQSLLLRAILDGSKE